MDFKTIHEQLSEPKPSIKSLQRTSGMQHTGKTQSTRSLIEAKQSSANIRSYTDENGVKHTVYLVTKPKLVTYFSYEYPPKTLYEYYDEWDWQKATSNNLNDPSTPNGNMNGRRTPNPEYGGSKRVRKTSKRSKRNKTRRGRK
jgi:hypothetical protein